MISRAHKSFVWLWMAALLSASAGVSVQQVYCYCLGKTTVSLFSADEICQREKSTTLPAGCCSKKAVPAKRSCCEKSDAEERGCTKRSTKVFQLKTEFEVASTDFRKLEAPRIWEIEPVFFTFTCNEPVVQKVNRSRFEYPPPELSGRLRCLRFGVFRC